VRRAAPVICCLALAACGGDDATENEPAPATQPAPAATAEDKVPSGVTKPGTTLRVGETARVLLTPLNASFDDKRRFQLETSVTDIRKVAISDLKNVNLDAEQKEATPYFVTIEIANPGKAVPADDDPGVRFKGVDDRGQEHNAVIFVGGFPQCDKTDMPRRFGNGKSYETCLVFMIPGGGTLEGVAWSSGIEYVDKPVTWK